MVLETPLYAEHVKIQGKIVEFAGYLLPVQFPAGIAAEHRQVREAAGLFDVSHMGEIFLDGPDIYHFLDELLPRDLSQIDQAIASRRALYSVMCNDEGTAVDDLLIYPLSRARCMLVVNAANIAADETHIRQQLSEWLARHPGTQVELANQSPEWAQLALQGPQSLQVLQRYLELNLPTATNLFSPEHLAALSALRRYQFIISPAGDWIISRTGYTGEDGFEFYVSPAQAPSLWRDLLAAGAAPIGLGARDTLRLEAAMPLYGHELSRTITPREAGLDRFLALDKPTFTGRAALQAHPARVLIGLAALGKAIPRADDPVLFNGRVVGHVTSGTFSPTRGQGIALALVAREAADPADLSQPAGDWTIEVRGKPEPFQRCPIPFV